MATMHTKAATDLLIEVRLGRPGGHPFRHTIQRPRTVRKATRLTRDVLIGAMAGLLVLVAGMAVTESPEFATIDGQFLGGGRAASDSITVVRVAGRGSIPIGTTAVAVNLTAVDAIGPGFLTVFRCGTDVPTASNMNYLAGGANPNMVLAPLDASSDLCIYALTQVHLIVDVVAVL